MARRGRLRRIGLATVVLAVMPWTAAAPEPTSDLMRDLAAFPQYREVRISTDARWIAWVQRTTSEKNPLASGSEVFARTLAPQGPAAVVSVVPSGESTSAPTDEEWISWSPDSKSLAFLSDGRSPGIRQLYVKNMTDGTIRQLTHLNGDLTTPSWSPDGRSIAILFTESSGRQAGPLAAVPQPTGVIDDQVLEQRIAVVDVASAAHKVISPPDMYVYEYDWSPDGKAFAVTAAHGSGDNNWYIAKIYTIPAAGGEAHEVFAPHTQIAVPRWSPDGQQIAFIAGLMSDEGIASGEISVIPADGGEARTLTPGLEGSAYWFAWPKGGGKRADGKSLVIAEALEGGSALATVDTRTGGVRVLWKGAETVVGPAEFARGISIAADGRTTAVIRESFNEPPALWTGAIGSWRRVSEPAVEPLKLWGQAQSVKWTIDGFDVQGWLVPPAVVEPGRKYPMVVWVHGGPAWLTAPSWPAPLDDSRILLLATRGYYVFFPNPRGSAGFGERFKQANIKDFGGGDLRDILAGIRQVVNTSPVDDSRIGLTGWSYGGFMTMWALTQTNRFRAAVVGAGLANWLSYYGENGIDEWMLPYFGASVYDDPAVYAKSSPMDFIRNVRTPTLLLVGDSDVECPPPQSYEYWHALKSFGVKTQLVIYPHEGHEFQNPEHVVDMLERMVTWFDDNMPEAAGHEAQ